MSYFWPEDLIAPVGIPPGVIAQLRSDALWNVEHFAGDIVSSRTEKQYLILTAGAGASITNVTPALGVTGVIGEIQHACPGDPVAASGTFLRQQSASLAADCFAATRPTLWACRFRMAAPPPEVLAAAGMIFPGGLFRHVATSSPVISTGTFWWYDSTIGVKAWRCSSLRAAQVDGTPAGTWDAFYHTCGFLHRGVDVLPFFDGVTLPPYSGADIQPSATIQSVAGKCTAAAAAAPGILLSEDWVAWAR